MFPQHLLEKRRAIVQARFDARYKIADNGCWLWTAGIEHGGYGRFYIGERSEGAHRASWRLHRGDIPTGMIVCHTCDTPACVNPDHLFCGTHADNNSDRSVKNRTFAPFGRGGARRKLTEDQVRLIRTDPRSCAVLGAELGVHSNTVSKIRLGRAWKHVTATGVITPDALPPKPKRVKKYSHPNGGFIVCRRSDNGGGLIGNLRPTEHTSLEAAVAEAERRSSFQNEEFAIFRQVQAVVPEQSEQRSTAA